MDRGVWVCRKEAEGTTFEEALTRYSNEIIPTKRSEKQEISINEQPRGKPRDISKQHELMIRESPRFLRRLQTLREWSHEQIKQVFP